MIDDRKFKKYNTEKLNKNINLNQSYKKEQKSRERERERVLNVFVWKKIWIESNK